MPVSIDAAALRAARLRSQRIAGPDGAGPDGAGPDGAGPNRRGTVRDAPASVGQTVRHLLAVQAQDFGQAVWALGLRTPGSARSDVIAALSNGEVIRSAPMRGTLHFLAAEDLRWMLGLTAERTLASARTRFRELGLDDDTFDRAAQVAASELAGGGSASREEFFALMRAAGISPEGQRGYHIIFNLSQRALVCWGPPRSTQQALVLVDEWVPQATDSDRPDALREFALRYFTGHGPATLRDFAWWAKLTLKDARGGLELARDELTEFTLDGQSYWGAADLPAPEAEREAEREPEPEPEPAPSAADAAVFALPGFDEYLLGYQDRDRVLAPEHVQQVIPGKNGLFRPILVAGGSVVGTWRRADVTDVTSIIAEPFAPLTTVQTKAVERVAAGYRTFMAG